MNTTTTSHKKVTLATVKAMIKRAGDTLLISKQSAFDGMCDGVIQFEKTGFKRITKVADCGNNMGISGVWFTSSTKNYFSEEKFDDSGKLIHVHVYNCCGSFNLKIDV